MVVFELTTTFGADKCSLFSHYIPNQFSISAKSFWLFKTKNICLFLNKYLWVLLLNRWNNTWLFQNEYTGKSNRYLEVVKLINSILKINRIVRKFQLYDDCAQNCTIFLVQNCILTDRYSICGLTVQSYSASVRNEILATLRVICHFKSLSNQKMCWSNHKNSSMMFFPWHDEF